MENDQVISDITAFIQQHLTAENSTGLEMFAREGDWYTRHLYECVSAMELWEIDPKYIAGLQRNFPTATIRNVDSIVHGRKCSDRFNLISLDNPQNIYGPGYCEHFEALPVASSLLRSSGILIFNVNVEPYSRNVAEENQDWLKRRAEYYATGASRLSETFVENFYRQLFRKLGYETVSIQLHFLQSKIPDHPNFIARCCTVLKAISLGCT